MKDVEKKEYGENPPTTAEQAYYRKVFEDFYPGHGKIVPYFWMPKYVDATDASARTLDIYNKTKPPSP
jgi:asparagine synthase (glutamine-hydrolysing)